MHDVNDNQHMDMDANGMPKEHYATFGETTFGPPSFDGAKFELTKEDQEFRIRFLYNSLIKIKRAS